MSVEDDCPVCDASESAKRTVARAKVAEHVKEQAGHDERHGRRVEEHTAEGTLAEIRAALDERASTTDG